MRFFLSVLQSIRENAQPALRTFAAIAILAMLAYPLALLGIGQLAFPRQSNGSVMMCNGKAVGSTLIGEHVTSPMLFHPSPSNQAASGVDPHITPQPAYAQSAKINHTPDIDAQAVRLLIDKN